ncbi:MAG: peptidylprolyl isomerase [Deltaproteobacteria bacterium]
MHNSLFTFMVSCILVTMLLWVGITSAADSDQKTMSPKLAGEAKKASAVIARVNGVEIKDSELRRAQKAILSGQPGMEVPPDQQKNFDQQVLSQLINTELLYQAGQKLVVKDLDKKIDDIIAKSKARFSNPDEYAKRIKALDLDELEIRNYTRRDAVILNFMEQTILPKVKVTEEENRKFYDQNLDKFKNDESVRASHILLGVDAKATFEEKKKAREKAEKLRKELVGGADFASLAKEHSTCPSSKQGGDLGYFGKGQMVPAFEQAAFALKPGSISDVVETQFGYHILKVAEKKAAGAVSFKDSLPRIEEFLKSQKVQTAVNAYLDEAKKIAKMEILLK